MKLVKDKYILNFFPSTIPKQWKVIRIQKRKRETEKILFPQWLNLLNEHYFKCQSSDWDTFTQARKMERKKKEKEEKDCWETFMLDISCWLYIAGIKKKKEKRKRNCFLKLIIICWSSPIEIVLYFKCTLVVKSFGCVLSSIDSSSFARICSSFVSLSLTLAKRLIASWKHYKRNFEYLTTVNIF